MSKIKLTELTKNSSLVNVNLNEAAEVSGGNGFDPYLFSINPDIFSTLASQGGAIMAQTQANQSAFYQDFRASRFNSMSEYALYRMSQR